MLPQTIGFFLARLAWQRLYRSLQSEQIKYIYRQEAREKITTRIIMSTSTIINLLCSYLFVCKFVCAITTFNVKCVVWYRFGYHLAFDTPEAAHSRRSYTLKIDLQLCARRPRDKYVFVVPLTNSIRYSTCS